MNFAHFGENLVDLVHLLDLVIFKCLNLGERLEGISAVVQCVCVKFYSVYIAFCASVY